MATVERLSHDLAPVDFDGGVDVIVQGEQGDRFYLIEEGQVEVFENGEFRRNEGPGESFGEIALLHDVPSTATVRTTEPTKLLELEREQFLVAVTGHQRSTQVAHGVVSDRWEGALETVTEAVSRRCARSRGRRARSRRRGAHAGTGRSRRARAGPRREHSLTRGVGP